VIWSTVAVGRQKRSPADFGLRGFFVPKNVVPKVRVELTQGHPYRFLSLVRVVLISVIKFVINSVIKMLFIAVTF